MRTKYLLMLALAGVWDADRSVESHRFTPVYLVFILVDHILDVVRHFLEFLEPQLGRLLPDVPVLLGIMQGRPDTAHGPLQLLQLLQVVLLARRGRGRGRRGERAQEGGELLPCLSDGQRRKQT